MRNGELSPSFREESLRTMEATTRAIRSTSSSSGEG